MTAFLANPAVWGHVASIVGGAVGMTALDRMMHGSTEDQIREQYKAQQKIEAEMMGQQAPAQAGPGLASLGRSEPEGTGMSEWALRALADDAKGALAVGRTARRARSSRDAYGDELENLIARDMARVMSLRTPRPISYAEVALSMGGL